MTDRQDASKPGIDYRPPLNLFGGYGVELEYMIVLEDSLDVFPISDKVLYAVAGDCSGDADRGEITWSNELVLHVIELKTTGPARELGPLPLLFHQNVLEINRILQQHGGVLLPGGMHPWMKPADETRLWPHDNRAIYEAYDRIFHCQGHGWANLQSTHLNLPFETDQEFERLMAAVRLLLPLLPALAAGSPLVEGKSTGLLDNRLDFYRVNQKKIRSLTGDVVPEPVFEVDRYHGEILNRLYSDIAPHDPEGILRHEWLNSRGAIARFERRTIEIRVLDVQECPAADMAVLALAVEALKGLVDETWSSLETQKGVAGEALKQTLHAAIREGDFAPVSDRHYLDALGLSKRRNLTAGEVWQILLGRLVRSQVLQPHQPALETILQQGPLARRILRVLDQERSRSAIEDVYRQLARCLEENVLFE